jgi:hypothetical protein
VFERLLGVGRLAAPLGLALGLLIGAQPVLADTEIGHTGTVGVHMLNDTSVAGVLCRYNYLSAAGKEKLVKLIVLSPNMKAVTGQTNQKVGWVVIVQRRAGATSTNPSWVNQFTSTEVTAYTSSSAWAYFQDRQITVSVPYAWNDTNHFANYRVNVKMIWHKANGQVQGTALHRVDHYFGYQANNVAANKTFNGNCSAYEPQF